MAQRIEIEVALFASGYCMAHQKIINPKTGKGKVKFYAVWALITIPDIGFALFDTGYADYFNQSTQHFPNKWYRLATPVFITKEQTAKSLLANKGISPNEIKYVFVSHFHADHIAALKDFSSAIFICAQSALDEVNARKGFSAVRKGILHDLLPIDFYARAIPLENFCDHITMDPNGFKTYHIFNTDALKLIALPGHARGMLGFILDTEKQKMLYATDASWCNEAYNGGILPNQVVRLFFDSWAAYKDTLQKIRSFETANPDFTTLFTHSNKTLSYIENEI